MPLRSPSLHSHKANQQLASRFARWAVDGNIYHRRHLLCLPSICPNLLAYKYHRMKILEVGAGTGSAIRLDAHSKLYKDYTFTDITTSFFAYAHEAFCDRKGMVFKKLDIGSDPSEQGFNSDHDLVIASQSLHATPRMADTIRNVRKITPTRRKIASV